MTRQEFMDRLKRALTSGLPANEVAEYVVYYQDYIEAQIRNGIAEEEVLSRLGDPRLIAKNILDVEKQKAEGNAGTNNYQEYQDYTETNYRNKRTSGPQFEYMGGNEKIAKFMQFMSRMPGWLWTVILIVLAIVVIGIVCSVLSFIMPFLLPILCIVLIVQVFNRLL